MYTSQLHNYYPRDSRGLTFFGESHLLKNSNICDNSASLLCSVENGAPGQYGSNPVEKAVTEQSESIGFSTFLGRLDALLKRSLNSPKDETTRVERLGALDGEAASELRKSFPVEVRRAKGAFFTSSNLAQQAILPLRHTFSKTSVLHDPSCGAGDLLLECARHLPAARDFQNTVERWSRQISGTELEPEFAQATKIRLLLSALERTRAAKVPNFFKPEPFSMIRVGSGLSSLDAIASSTHIILNPPFFNTNAPADCGWATGKINASALFMDVCTSNANAGTRIVAVLPDVLRSGTRYARWRKMIEQRASIERVSTYGRFDRWTDVDVFILELKTNKRNSSQATYAWTPVVQRSAKAIEDFFDVSVGPVVDYRDPHDGRLQPYAVARELSAWQTVTTVARRRRFKGRLTAPPFVVVRRTSRPGEASRTTATVISTPYSVAVDNHLLILRPKDGKLSTCIEALEKLRTPSITDWVNARIRCRHITVGILNKIPWR